MFYYYYYYFLTDLQSDKIEAHIINVDCNRYLLMNIYTYSRKYFVRMVTKDW